MRTLLQKSSLLSCMIALAGAPLLAAPAAWTDTTRQAFWQENFTLPDNTKADSGATGWTSTAPYSLAVYGVAGNEFKVHNTNSYKGAVTWTSALINIAGKTSIQLSVTARSAVDVGGWLEYDDSNIYDLQLADYIRMYYKVDGGPEILFGDLRSNIKSNCGDSTVYSTGAISGSNVQIIVRSRATAADEYYYFDNVTVSGIAGCTAADLPSEVTGFASDRLTCNVTTVNMNGSSSTAGVLYTWSGPNSFSATGAHAQVSAPGTYTFTVTNPTNGCSKSIPIIVSRNITPPADITASNSGPITCIVSESTLTGGSSSANVEYQWDGPDGYLSFSAEDVAYEAGDYVLTVTNTDNGCTLKDTTSVGFNCSPARRVTDPAVAAAATVATPVFEWKAWPNPFTERASVSFRSPAAGFITVQVYAGNGILEKTLFENKAMAGREYQVYLSGLPSGIHYIFIRINNNVYTKKMISLK